MTSFAFDPSGRLVPPTSEELAKADEDSTILVYMATTLEDGQPYYAYIAVKPSKYAEFQAASAARQRRKLSEFGTVIASGYEQSPPPDVVAMIRDEYGFDDDYMEKLQGNVLQQHAVFLKKREDDRINDIVAMLKKKQSGS